MDPGSAAHRCALRLVRGTQTAVSYQSRYSAGLVSGMASHSKSVAAAATPASVKKPAQWPKLWNRNPVAAVLSEAATAISVPTIPRVRLKRPVPVVMSVITRMVSTVTVASHGAGGEGIAGRVEPKIPPGARRHRAAADEAEADRGDRRRDDPGGEPVQNLGQEHQREG